MNRMYWIFIVVGLAWVASVVLSFILADWRKAEINRIVRASNIVHDTLHVQDTIRDTFTVWDTVTQKLTGKEPLAEKPAAKPFPYEYIIIYSNKDRDTINVGRPWTSSELENKFL